MNEPSHKNEIGRPPRFFLWAICIVLASVALVFLDSGYCARAAETEDHSKSPLELICEVFIYGFSGSLGALLMVVSVLGGFVLLVFSRWRWAGLCLVNALAIYVAIWAVRIVTGGV